MVQDIKRMQSKNLDRIFKSLGYDVQRVRVGIDHRCTDDSHLDLDVRRLDDRAWHGCPERPSPKLRTGIGVERVYAVVGGRHKENILCADSHVERLSVDESVHGHTE